jgi:hypothetical protein
VVAVAVQSVFRLEIHQNDVFFYFLKINFEINISKRSENIKKKIFSKKKKFDSFFLNIPFDLFMLILKSCDLKLTSDSVYVMPDYYLRQNIVDFQLLMLMASW